MKYIATFLLLLANLSIALAQQTGLSIHHLGANHTLLRITEAQKYLLLPIEEVAPEATVNILVDNKCNQTIQVRMAVNRIDYYVPFDLTPYKDKHVIFDVHTGNSRTNIREAKNDACWKEVKLSNEFSTANTEKYRPLFHHTPLYGWMNDPNGMVYQDGTYHLFYQYNPYGSMWGNMNWGHSTSTDLIHWEDKGVAIAPNGLGTVFSGSSVIDKNNTSGFGENTIVSLYTSAGASQMQSMAYSTDGGNTFNVYDGNPVITEEIECRDPNFFWHEPTQKWVLVLASSLAKEMHIYNSDNLKDWTLVSKFGKGYGQQDGVWECPDLMELPIHGTNEKRWVLICNINPGGPFGGSAAQYFVGDFDGKTFRCDTPAEVTRWMDYGMDHYAAVSWSNAPQGRHTVIAWMSNWLYANNVPTKQFRSANSLPRDLELFRDTDGELYLASIPSPEVNALRSTKPTKYGNATATKKGFIRRLPHVNDGVCEIMLDINAHDGMPVILTLSNDAGEEVEMIYTPTADTFSMNRERSGIVDFNKDFPCTTVAPAHSDDNRITLRLFIDRCSIEAFSADGRMAMTNLVFPTKPYTSLKVRSEKGRTRIGNLTIYPIQCNR